jgi:ABC-type uncharacterized transport system YnjBCD ATPase subunit
MLAVARALIANPELILMDEPSDMQRVACDPDFLCFASAYRRGYPIGHQTDRFTQREPFSH